MAHTTSVLRLLVLVVPLCLGAGLTDLRAQQYQWSNFVGMPGGAGNTEGIVSEARFDHPADAAVDAGGNVYVADSSNHTIRKVTPSGVVTTIVYFSPDLYGYGPHSVAADSSGNVYVADAGNNMIRMITPGGDIITLGGTAGVTGSRDGVRCGAAFSHPGGMTISSAGVLFVADTNNNRIARGTPITTIQYALNVAASPAGGGSVAGGGSCDEGSLQPITATASSNWLFTGWTGTGITAPGAASTTVLIDGDKTVTANFTAINYYTLTVTASPGTGGSVTGGGSFVQGSLPPISAASNSNWRFAGWSGTGVTAPDAAATTVLIDGDKTVTANFSALGGYLVWANDPAQRLTAGVNNGPSDDPDHDGISNLLEFALGGAPMTSSQAILPKLTHSADTWVFEYKRSDLSQPFTTQIVEYGSDLTGWTQMPVTADSSDHVTVIPGSPADHVKVSIPALGAKGFVRLKISQ